MYPAAEGLSRLTQTSPVKACRFAGLMLMYTPVLMAA
jgi:hypothetical protein